ncbi:MAG: DUF6867 family protein [Kiloniellaceae bacterium]
MEQLLGTTWPVFIGVTVIVMGLTSFVTGQGLANTWRPMWQTVPYCVLLGCVDRFLVWGLFQGELFILSGFVIDSLVLLAIALIAYRLTQARKMVAQYPWIYERCGPFGWRRKL